MTLLTPQTTPANRVLPHLLSEVSRLLHRRLYRWLTAILLVGIVGVSAIAFFTASASEEVPPEARRQYERALADWDRDFDSIVEGWEQCLDETPAGESVENYCGNEPDYERDKPQLEWFYNDRRYHAAENLPLAVFGATMAAAMLAFILGASSGGAEWSSRSMTLQLLWEPRRLRLLSLKGVALSVVTALTTMAAIALAGALAALTATARGTWDGVENGLTFGAENAGNFWPQLLLTGARGVVLVVIVASFGYGIAMLTRNTGAALGVAFVYFAVVENAVRIAFQRWGSEPWILSTNAVGFLTPGGVDVPGGMHRVEGGAPGESYLEATMVHLSNGRSLLVLTGYLLLLAIPAVYSFTRRDVS